MSYTKKLELEVISSSYFGFYSDPFRRFLVFSLSDQSTPPGLHDWGPSGSFPRSNGLQVSMEYVERLPATPHPFLNLVFTQTNRPHSIQLETTNKGRRYSNKHRHLKNYKKLCSFCITGPAASPLPLLLPAYSPILQISTHPNQ